MTLKLEGVYTALITPFTEDGNAVDYDAFKKLVDFQIESGVDGLVPVGTTGESPTLSAEEKKKVIEICVQKAKGKCKVIAGTGSNNTAATVAATKQAKDLGADAVLIVNPYYNKPSQEGLFQHICKINEVGIPIVLYNIPGRTGIAMTPQTIARIYSNCNMVVAVKEATGSLDTASEIASLCDITILSGDDSLSLPICSIGGKGVISVLSNWQPKKVQDIVKNALKGDYVAAATAQKENLKLMKTMFLETNPVPIKYSMHLDGFCSSTVRLPLAPLTDDTIEKVTSVLLEYQLITKEKARK